MKFPRNAVVQVVEALLLTGAHTATKFLGSKAIVRATRPLEDGKLPKRGNIEIRVTMGLPNYRERQFIKDCFKAGENLPVKRVQIKYPPKRRGCALPPS